MRLSIFIALLFLAACGSKKQGTPVLDGKKLFKLNCSVCHGIDGRLQANGSKDLTLSTLTKAERTIVVRKGRGVMTPFEKVLTKEEIDKVVDYTLSFKTE